MFGQVVSANCVGYAQSDAVDSKFNAVVGMFENIGTDHVLGDFTLVNGTFGGSSIQFVNENGGTSKYTLTQEMIESGSITEDLIKDGKVDKSFYFMSYDEAKDYSGIEDDTPVEEWDYKPGWYLTADEGATFLMNNEEVKYATGFLFKPENEEAQLQTAGQVPAGDTAIQDLTDSIFQVVGNAFPSATDLGSIVLVNGTFGGSSIQFVNENGGTEKYTLTQEMIESGSITEDLIKDGKVDKSMYYMNYDEAKEYSGIEDDTPVEDWDYKPGWYLTADEGATFLMNAEEVKRGAGFLFKPENADATLVFPGLED